MKSLSVERHYFFVLIELVDARPLGDTLAGVTRRTAGKAETRTPKEPHNLQTTANLQVRMNVPHLCLGRCPFRVWDRVPWGSVHTLPLW